MAKIIVNRSSSIFNGTRSFDIWIDNKKAGSIKNGSSEEFNIAEGEHIIQCKLMWYASNPVTVTLKSDQVKVLKVAPHPRQWIVLGIVLIGFILLPLITPVPHPEWYKQLRMICFIGIIVCMILFVGVLRKSALQLKSDHKSIFN